MTQPSSPRRATAEEIETAKAAWKEFWLNAALATPLRDGDPALYAEAHEAVLNAVFALLPPGTVAPEGWPELIAAERTGCTVTLTFERDVTQAEFRRIGLLVEPAAPSPPASETA